MIRMEYRERSLTPKTWEVYAESNRITKDMRQFARELANNEHRHMEHRYIDTRTGKPVTA